MAREFSAEGLISLPKLSIDSGLALWQALQAGVAAEKKLPKFLQGAWQGVHRAGELLQQAAQSRLIASSTKAPSDEKRKTDGVVDNAVGALDDYLAAWARLPDTVPQAQLAAGTRQALFPDGTGFLKLPFAQEWAQIDRRVALIKSAGLDQQIAQLGGAPFVVHLEQAHLAYGKALGLTTVPAAPTETVGLREPLTALESALRLYVIKVIAYRDAEEPSTGALADRLLRPILTWTSRAPKPSGDSAADPETDPAAKPDGEEPNSA